MKLNKSYFMGLFITFLMVGIAGIVAGVAIVTNPDSEILHRGRLHTLYFENSNDVGIKVQSGASYLSILNGLIVGVNVSASGASGSIIGGGYRNVIKAQNAGIAGGQSNRIHNGDYSAIGGGNGNNLWGENSVVAGGSGNKAGNGAVIVGGENNQGNNNGVILGGLNNKAEEKNSLVMGSGAKGSGESFVWSDDNVVHPSATQHSAHIDASNGVLIGTKQPVSGVRLTVNGAVKLGSGNSHIRGEVSVNGSGCIRAFDGIADHVLGKGSESGCTVVTGQCLFGSTLLQNGDKVMAYTMPYSEDCDSKSKVIMCKDGMLCNGEDCGYSYNKYYPYCYGVSKSNENNREYPDRYRILNP